MLTAEQVSNALDATSRDSVFDDITRALEAELHRLENGPFTLAEAVASGRPFRRKAWDAEHHAMRYWFAIWNSYADGFMLGESDWDWAGLASTSVDDDSDRWYPSADDITATDYELQPEVA